MTDRVSIYDRDELTISFTEDGKVQGFWTAFERVKVDYAEKISKGNASKGYTDDVTRINALIQLSSNISYSGVQAEYLDIMAELALLIKSTAEQCVRLDKEGKTLKINIEGLNYVQNPALVTL